MKICFIQKQPFPYVGVMAVSGKLKQQGHETDVLIQAFENDICGSLKKIKPDLIGFSVLSSEHNWLKNLAMVIKKQMPQIPIIVGGVHAVLFPDDIMKIEAVDYACHGEGEIAFPLLVNRISEGHSTAQGITGIGYRKDGIPCLQGVAPLVQDLASFNEDRFVYYIRYPKLRDLALKQFMSSRGCPFRCSFCANLHIMKTFSGSGAYIRRKPAGFFVNEIEKVISDFGAKSIFFNDDLFGVLDDEWLTEFVSLYKVKIRIPFMCIVHARIITKARARLLASAKCHTVSFGIETGNEWLRKNILKKDISNEDIIKCAAILREEGIRIQTSNMFCLPEEKVSDAISTVDLNIKIGTSHMFTTIFLPLPRTELADYCIQKNLLKKDYSFGDMPESYVKKSVLSIKDKEYLINIHKVAHLCLKFPKLKKILLFLARNIKCSYVFSLFWLIGTVIRYKEERNLTYLQTIRYLWLHRKGY